MRKNLLFAITAMFLATQVNAQSTLIHYWHFNTLTVPMYTDTIHGIAPDYSIHDTSKAKILYAKKSGVSAMYSTYLDGYGFSAGSPDFDTVNVRMSAPPGYGLRTRNPSDSMQLLFYIPTVHYKNIVLTFGCERSNNGMIHQLYDYSVDSGLTWRTAALSQTTDSMWLIVHRTTITFTTDTEVNNNSKLVFRIQFSGNDTGASGNNRFDNVSVDGDSIIAPLSVPAMSSPLSAYSLYPNPVNDLLEIAAAYPAARSYIVYNEAGKQVDYGRTEETTFHVNTWRLAAGIYFISIRENASGHTNTVKFIKQ